jgi:hypothetical protein
MHITPHIAAQPFSRAVGPGKIRENAGYEARARLAGVIAGSAARAEASNLKIFGQGSTIAFAMDANLAPNRTADMIRLCSCVTACNRHGSSRLATAICLQELSRKF